MFLSRFNKWKNYKKKRKRNEKRKIDIDWYWFDFGVLSFYESKARKTLKRGIMQSISIMSVQRSRKKYMIHYMITWYMFKKTTISSKNHNEGIKAFLDVYYQTSPIPSKYFIKETSPLHWLVLMPDCSLPNVESLFLVKTRSYSWNLKSLSCRQQPFNRIHYRDGQEPWYDACEISVLCQPMISSSACENKNLPLYYTPSYSDSVELIQHLWQRNPAATKSLGYDNNTPFHIAFQYVKSSTIRKL